MIERVGGGNDLLALLQARTANKRSATGTAQTAKEAEAAAALEQKRQRTDDLLRSLDRMVDSVKRERKAAAVEKVERLKKELEMLRRFGGDPKAVARQAARIARELGAAAREYSSAGGGADVSAPSSGVSGSAPAAQTGEQAGDTGAQDAEGAAENATAMAESGAGAVEANAANGAKAAASEAERVAADVQAKAGGAEQNTEKAKDTSKPLSPEEERAAFVEKLNAKLGESQRKFGESEADKKFESDVRRLFAEAKALVEQQRRRAAVENRSDAELEQFSNDVAQAGEAIEQAFSVTMEPGLFVAPAPVNITV